MPFLHQKSDEDAPFPELFAKTPFFKELASPTQNSFHQSWYATQVENGIHTYIKMYMRESRWGMFVIIDIWKTFE